MGFRDEFKPGDIVEVTFTGHTARDMDKYNGIRAIVVRPLGTHEDFAGNYDYVVSWDWTDDRLLSFFKELGATTEKDLLDPRFSKLFLKLADCQHNITAHDIRMTCLRSPTD